MNKNSNSLTRVNRREALLTAGALSTTLAVPSLAFGMSSVPDHEIKLGMIADLHGGLAVDADQRLDAFLKAMREEQCDALVQMGDFAYPNAKHQTYADRFNEAHTDTIHVIGNHEFDFGLKRADCFKAWNIESAYYQRDVGGIRILVLDGNEKGSPIYKGGYPSFVGEDQLKWLDEELSSSDKPVLILSHQPLAGHAAVDNAESIQRLLAQYRSKILLCVNGHTHLDTLVQVDGIPYLHLNSASYYWVGGKQRMAYYTDPLFTTLTIDPDSATIRVAKRNSQWREQSPADLKYFDQPSRPNPASVTPVIRAHSISRTKLRVMAWNIWGRLNQDPRYTLDEQSARQRTIDLIQNSRADIVTLVETYGSASDIAEALNFHVHTVADDANLCILSRYPLSNVTPLKGLNPFSFLAATATLPGGKPVRVYAIWLTSSGRHIVEIKDKSVSDEEFAAGDEVRAEQLDLLLQHETFVNDMEESSTTPLILAGDFNCVSHLDHTQATADRNLNFGRVLPIQVSRSLATAGFEDTYRAAHPKVAEESLGYTWTTVGTDYVYQSGKGFVPVDDHPRPEYQDPYTRIDYIYSKGPIKVVAAEVLDRNPEYPDQRFPAFPSDHAAVITDFQIQH